MLFGRCRRCRRCLRLRRVPMSVGTVALELIINIIVVVRQFLATFILLLSDEKHGYLYKLLQLFA